MVCSRIARSADFDRLDQVGVGVELGRVLPGLHDPGGEVVQGPAPVERDPLQDLDGSGAPHVAGGAELDGVDPGVVGGAGPVRVVPLRGVLSEDAEQAEGVPAFRHGEPDQVPGPGVGVSVRSVLRLELGQPPAADADLPAQRGVHEPAVDVAEARDLGLRRDQRQAVAAVAPGAALDQVLGAVLTGGAVDQLGQIRVQSGWVQVLRQRVRPDVLSGGRRGGGEMPGQRLRQDLGQQQHRLPSRGRARSRRCRTTPARPAPRPCGRRRR